MTTKREIIVGGVPTQVETREVEIIAKERETKDGTKKFMTYKVVTKNNTLMQLKFTSQCEDDCADNGIKLPRTDGKYLIELDAFNTNVSKNGVYPTMWVRKVHSVREKPTVNAFNFEEYFGDDLPL